MPETRQRRRLAAILAADVVGYTSAMAEDEAGTLAKVQMLLRDVVAPAVTGQDGRIFKEMGDGLLAEFPSAVGAAQCAAAIQTALAASGSELQLRIGLHVGDVIVEGDDLFGDGINIAARLEAEAEPGGIVVSDALRQQAEGRNGLIFDDLGARQLKNVAEPMHIHALRRDDIGGRQKPPRHRAARANRLLFAGAAAVMFGIAIFWGALRLLDYGPPGPSPEDGPPSIAVLPFDNLSQDVEQAYFADGLTEDLITDLSKIEGVRVVSRTSSFAYRGKGVPLNQIGAQLRVRYIVEGSVRRAGDQLRITASLIDTVTDTPVWSERFEGSGTDVFAFQDAITDDIIAMLKVQLTPDEQQAMAAQPTGSMAAYDAYLRGLRYIAARRRLDIEANTAAQAAFEEAIRLDPNYALAYAGLAWTKWLFVESINVFNWEADSKEAFTLAEKSISIEDNALARRTLAKRHLALMNSWVGTTRDSGAAVAELEAAHKLQPNDPDVMADLATALPFVGRPNDALKIIHQAMELNPSHPGWYFAASGIAYLLTGQAELAIRDLERWRDDVPNWPVPYIFLASAYGLAGDTEAGKAAFDRHSYLYNDAVVTLYAVTRIWPMKPAEEEIFLRGLKAAGVKDIPG